MSRLAVVLVSMVLVGAAVPATAEAEDPGAAADDRRDSVTVTGQNRTGRGTATAPGTSPGGPTVPVLSCTPLFLDAFSSVGIGCWNGCEPPQSGMVEVAVRPSGCRPTVPISAVRAVVVERVRHRLPMLKPTRQPAAGTALIRIPVIFASGQAGGGRTYSDVVAGLAITTTVRPTWRWDFGDGSSLTTDQPGGPWPDTSVSHPYDMPGRHPVTATATWDGTFTIAGVGSFPITGEVTQTARLTVRVVPARAVLVPR